MPLTNSITDVPGLLVGHAHDAAALTGCTVVLCPDGAVGGVDQRGGAPGTRETDALHPLNLVQQVHAVVLAGGSAFGLDAATGVMRYLDARGVGFDARVARVPIVPAAILFDLGVGRADIRPDAAMGYQACLNATAQRPAEGNAGAGMGATVGKILGTELSMKAGIGTASAAIGDGVIVGALAAVNAYGDILDPHTGEILAGVRGFELEGRWIGRGRPFADTLWVMEALARGALVHPGPPITGGNTIIGVVATNARLNKEQVNRVAQMAHDGLARTVRPAHTLLDGDTIFALSLGDRPADVDLVGAYAAEVFAAAILNGIRTAEPAAGLPSIQTLKI